ncbi:MAG: energy-coupling factor transporter ATPase [Lachnospiraceae bacterium]|nr:energy-coupling factor transporter ATPase [Lachnospiraceae bacterium]
MSFIEFRNVTYDYTEYGTDETEISSIRALTDVTLDVKEGDFVAVLGHNGSGKSTMIKHINAILFPTEGTVLLTGRDTKEADPVWEIRRDAGMIFQNPDNQIIGTSVEEDVAFGPENMGVPTEELEKRVEETLERVGLTAYRLRSPNQLSGGQKQRVAIAGLLAMHPKCILMDEATAMLDPEGRKEVLETVHELNKTEGITVLLVTHNMEEAAGADRVIVMDKGRVVMTGTPKEIFSRTDELVGYGLTLPDATLLANELREAGLPIPAGILTEEELAEELSKIYRAQKDGASIEKKESRDQEDDAL